MKKLLLSLALSINFIVILGQIESYSNYSFNGNQYNACVIEIDTMAIKKFRILNNDKKLPHQAFLSELKNIDTSFILVNASISDSSCNPIGYFVKDSKLIQPANFKDGIGNFYLKPNGALLVTANDAYICESTEIGKSQGVILGIQSGPLLLNNGSINSNFNRQSANKYIRSGVGQFSNKKGQKFLIFCISNNPVSFYDFALLFNKKFKCDTALCLESAGCTMYYPNQPNPIANFNGLICNYIYFGD